MLTVTHGRPTAGSESDPVPLRPAVVKEGILRQLILHTILYGRSRISSAYSCDYLVRWQHIPHCLSHRSRCTGERRIGTSDTRSVHATGKGPTRAHRAGRRSGALQPADRCQVPRLGEHRGQIGGFDSRGFGWTGSGTTQHGRPRKYGPRVREKLHRLLLRLQPGRRERWTLDGLARELHMPRSSVYELLLETGSKSRRLPARREPRS